MAKTYTTIAKDIKLEASGKIELKCGGSSIIITPGAVIVKGGPLIKLNSGSGPSVSAVKAKLTEPDEPLEYLEADEVEFGKDTTYGGGEEPAKAAPVTGGKGADFKPAKSLKVETSWIEIEMIDAAGKPVAGEPFLIKLPNGNLRRGSLDANGFARIAEIKPGSCQISFPTRDAATWERV